MAKRLRENEVEFDDLSLVNGASPSAKIHGKLTVLSPMKKAKSCNYFDGEIADDSGRTLRVFGFDSSVRKKLSDHYEDKKAVVLSGCEVKRSSYMSGDLEVFVGKSTEVAESNRTINVALNDKKMVSKLSEVKKLVSFQRVTVEVKVVRMEDAVEVTGGKKKRDLIVGDASGSCRCTLWEADIDRLEDEKCYRLKEFMVKEFRGEKYLSSTKQQSVIEEIGDIGDVEEEDEEEGASGCKQFDDVRVVGVDRLDNYSGCMKCGSKVVVDAEDEELGTCMKCGMLQAIEECKKTLTAQLRIKNSVGCISLRAFEKCIMDIVQNASEVTPKTLLKAKPFNICFKDGVIISIVRKI